jgi:hypothetical protein
MTADRQRLLAPDRLSHGEDRADCIVDSVDILMGKCRSDTLSLQPWQKKGAHGKGKENVR